MVLVAKLKQIFKRLKNISLKYIDANKNIIWGKEIITAVKIVIFIIIYIWDCMFLKNNIPYEIV